MGFYKLCRALHIRGQSGDVSPNFECQCPVPELRNVDEAGRAGVRGVGRGAAPRQRGRGGRGRHGETVGRGGGALLPLDPAVARLCPDAVVVVVATEQLAARVIVAHYAARPLTHTSNSLGRLDYREQCEINSI